MAMRTALAAAATLLALAFALCALEGWRTRRRAYEAVWGLALAIFAAASAALWVGATFGWSPGSFRTFYLLGAVISVPVLALGSIVLVGSPRAARLGAVGTAVGCAFAAGVVIAAPLRAPVPPDRLAQGSEVFGALPRILAAVASTGGSILVLGVAVASAAGWRGARSGSPRVVANLLVVAATAVLGAGGLANSVVGEMEAFALSLVVGVALLFGAFLAGSSDRNGPVSQATRAQSATHDPELDGGGGQDGQQQGGDHQGGGGPHGPADSRPNQTASPSDKPNSSAADRRAQTRATSP
ncbi:MAG: hypothetical protein ACT4OS_00825 [Acidimicrobiales bacterium]